MLSRMCNIVFCCGSWTKFVCRRTVCVLNALHKSRTHNSLFTVLPARAQTLLPATALLTGTQEATASIILSNSWQTCNKCSNGIALPDVSMFAVKRLDKLRTQKRQVTDMFTRHNLENTVNTRVQLRNHVVHKQDNRSAFYHTTLHGTRNELFRYQESFRRSSRPQKRVFREKLTLDKSRCCQKPFVKQISCSRKDGEKKRNLSSRCPNIENKRSI